MLSPGHRQSAHHGLLRPPPPTPTPGSGEAGPGHAASLAVSVAPTGASSMAFLKVLHGHFRCGLEPTRVLVHRPVPASASSRRPTGRAWSFTASPDSAASFFLFALKQRSREFGGEGVLRTSSLTAGGASSLHRCGNSGPETFQEAVHWGGIWAAGSVFVRPSRVSDPRAPR